jgi:hypothetical protein
MRLGTGAIAVLVVVLACGGAGTRSIALGQDVPIAWSEMEKFFLPPEQYKGGLSDYRSLMKFDNGAPVKTRQVRSRQREEILRYCHGVMGPWPALVETPRVKYFEKEHVENFTRHSVQVEFAPDRFGARRATM